MEKLKIAMFSSRKLNEDEVFQKHKEKIKQTLEQFDKENITITIGNIKNKLVIEYVKSLGYDVLVRNQVVTSLENSNKKIIREHDLIIFNIYNNSSNMLYFLDYAIEQGKDVMPMHLS